MDQKSRDRIVLSVSFGVIVLGAVNVYSALSAIRDHDRRVLYDLMNTEQNMAAKKAIESQYMLQRPKTNGQKIARFLSLNK